MNFDLLSVNSSVMQKQTIGEILECNNLTARFGLELTQAQAVQLAQTRVHSLKENGRVEFGGGILPKIIREFCASPYITNQNFSPVMNELVEIFYYYKNETLDNLSDDELIGFMHNAFDGSCRGSLELLAGRELARMANTVPFGGSFDDIEETSDEANGWEEEDDDGEY